MLVRRCVFRVYVCCETVSVLTLVQTDAVVKIVACAFMVKTFRVEAAAGAIMRITH
jgi:hypothetical protein